MNENSPLNDLEHFYKAIQTGNIDDFKKYFRDDFLEKEQDNMRPIHFACSNGHIEIARFLINKGCNIESYNKKNWYPIHFICRYGYFEILEMLIKKECNLEVTTLDLMRPIHFACKYGYIEIAVLLVERNCEVDVQTESNQSPLDLAIENGNEELIDIIKEKVKNPKLNPIHIACKNGYLNIVKLLISQNCNIEALDEKGWRPLHHAARENRLDVTKELLKNKCEIDPKNIDNWTPLHYASGYGHSQIVETLIEAHSDFEAVTNDNWRPIHNACRFGHLEVIKVLLNHNCNIEVRDKDNRTPVHYVCMKGYIDILELFISRNCDLEARDNKNWRPIHHACKNEQIAIVEKLFLKECDLNAITSDKKTPLSLAESKRNEKLIEMLVDEIGHLKMVSEMVELLKIECYENCDHKFCSSSLRLRNLHQGKFVGKGGYGKVFRCVSVKTSQIFAVKRLPESDIINFKELEESIRTIQRKLDHPRIIKIYCSFQKIKIKTNNKIKRKLFIIMDFLEGGTLEDKIRNENKLPKQKVIHFSKQILEGIEYLHEQEIIHRDIKPGNVLMDLNENIKLADFDICRKIDENSLTTFCGTSNFMAPEVINGTHYSFSADIWSVGATIFNMITGNPPYHEFSITPAVIYNIVAYGFQVSEELNGFKTLINEMMNNDKDARPNAKELLANEIFNSSS